MSITFPVLGVAFVAFCIWLGVRIINRRERWAKWTLATLPMVMAVLYPVAYLLLMNPIWAIPYFGAGWERYPLYRVFPSNDENVISFFSLAHRIDRKVRPEFWGERRPY